MRLPYEQKIKIKLCTSITYLAVSVADINEPNFPFGVLKQIRDN